MFLKNQTVENAPQDAQNDAPEQFTDLIANNPENQHQEGENNKSSKKTARQSPFEKAQKTLEQAEMTFQIAKEQEKTDEKNLENYKNLILDFANTLKCGCCRAFKKSGNAIIAATLSANYAVQSALNNFAKLQPQRTFSLVYYCPANQADRVIKIDDIERVELIFTNENYQENFAAFLSAQQN
jgi:hypothetical protein